LNLELICDRVFDAAKRWGGWIFEGKGIPVKIPEVLRIEWDSGTIHGIPFLIGLIHPVVIGS
jgi:hypothetical protein